MPAVRTHPSSSALALFRRAAVVVPVLLLHVMLLWLLTQSRPERADVKAAQATVPMALRWIETEVTALPRRLPKAVPDPEPNKAAVRAPRQVSRAITTATSNSNSLTSLPPAVETSQRPDSAALAPEAAAASSSRPGPATLDLRLPRGTAAVPPPPRPSSLATQDGRANSARPSFGEKLAEALGSDDRRTEEGWGDGRIRIRQGADCVIVEESRAGQLDPMSQTTRPSPRGVKPCK